MQRKFTAYNPGGETVMTDGDRIAMDQNRQSMEAQIALAQLQAQREIANINSGDNRYNTNAMVATQGKFTDRAAHDNTLEAMRGQNQLANTNAMGAGNLAVAKEGNAPAMGDLKLRSDKFDIERPAMVAKAGVEAQRAAAQGELMKRFLPQGGGAGGSGAPGVAGGSPIDADAAAAYAFGADPGDVLRMQGDEKRFQRGQTAQADQVKYTTAIQLLQSPKPEAQAVGAKMLSELQSFKGVDTGALQGALAPERAAGEAYASRPSLQMDADRLIHDAKELGNSSNPQAGAVLIKQRMQEIAKKASALGVRPEEALAFLQNRLEKEVPSAGFWNAPISSTVEGLSFGLIPAKDTSSRTQARGALGLTREGM